jgi:DNA-binding NarL/FixJ family response regulator
MLTDIVKDIIASHEDIDVISEIARQDELLHTAIRTRADVIVLGEAAASDRDDYRELLYRRPQLKILAITADGRRGFLHELQPRVMSLGEVSPASLIEAIRGQAPYCSAGTR